MGEWKNCQRALKFLTIDLMRGWPTQIGSWVAFGKFSKNIDFLGQFLIKTEEKHSKYRKIAEFQFKIGPQKFLCNMRHAGRGLVTPDLMHFQIIH